MLITYNMDKIVTDSFSYLKSYCETENFAGWDPYDGLNSKIFQYSPLKKYGLFRLAWIQFFKRCPVNLRKPLLVPKMHNNMGLGLFLSGYCLLFKLAQNGESRFGDKEEILKIIEKLGDLIVKYQSSKYAGSCWGYNFDWQARLLFFFPAGTPNVVVTAFCADALFDAYKIIPKQEYLDSALSASDFVIHDLNQTTYKSGIIFSYSPKDGNNTVFNASLLGAKILLRNYAVTSDAEKLNLAKKAVNAALDGQAVNGSWVYGLLPVQDWVDSFHTGFNLNALQLYYEITQDINVKNAIEIGTDFYTNNFFLEDGTPKYYHNRTYPIDIHCPGQLLMSLHDLGIFYENQNLAERVLKWTIKNMQDKKGYFYYQLKKGWSSKISYMRWSNAFMFNAIAHYLVAKSEK